MKKSKIIICTLILVFLLTACGNGTENITTSQSITTIQTTTVYTETTTVAETTVIQPVTTIQQHITEKETTTGASTTIPTTPKPTTTAQTTKLITTTKPSETTTKPTTIKLTTTEPTTAEAKSFCTVRIECKTIYNNLTKFKDSKKSFLTSSGVILNDVQVEISGSESAFDVLKKACSENVCTDNCKYCKQSGIQLEYTYTPAFNNYYIEGIHQIYEKDCGSQSGWMYSVNGIFPDTGSSSYTVSPGDTVVFAFTCNMGEDIGN